MSIDLVIRNMDGYDTPFHFEGEIRAINRWSDTITSGVIVSIGSFRGQMDCALALHAHVPVYCIDPRQGWVGEDRDFGDTDRPYWMQNIMALGLANKVRPIELPSLLVATIWDKPIGLLWIDGNHVEVDADLDAWLPHVVDGGLVALHDSNSPMIISAVASRSDLVEIERADLTVIYRKEGLYELYEYDGVQMLVRRGPYNHDDKYVLAEVRGYDIGTEPIRTCIDVGAHIGAFSAWLHSLWPDCQIVAVEPEMSGYLTALANVGDADEIALLNVRVNYDQDDKVLYVNPVNSGCHKVKDKGEPGEPVVPAPAAVTLEELMGVGGFTTLDLLKIDAEGAEVDILTNCSDDLLRKTRRIVGESHFGYDAFIEGIGARLQALGFEVTAETNPALHSTFLAVNNRWQENPIAADVSKVAPAPKPQTKPSTRRSKKRP